MSADLDFGKLAFKFQGNFELDKQYEKLDCVYHDFSTYLAINTPIIGEEPSNSSDWVLLCKGYGLASEQEVVDGVVDNKAVSAKELKNNKATKDDIITGTGDNIVTPEALRFLGGFTHTLFEVYTAGAGTWVAPDYYGDGKPYKAEVVIIGGGAGASAGIVGNGFQSRESGASGGLSLLTAIIVPNTSYNYVVGSGGVSLVVSANGLFPVTVSPTGGGSSAMFGETVTGGGLAGVVTGAVGVGNYIYSGAYYSPVANFTHIYNVTMGGPGAIVFDGCNPASVPFSKRNAGSGSIGLGLFLRGSGAGAEANRIGVGTNGNGFPGMINILVRARN